MTPHTVPMTLTTCGITLLLIVFLYCTIYALLWLTEKPGRRSVPESKCKESCCSGQNTLTLGAAVCQCGNTLANYGTSHGNGLVTLYCESCVPEDIKIRMADV